MQRHNPGIMTYGRADATPADRRDRPLAVTLAILTCRRPALLEQVLGVVASLEQPTNAQVSILIVDNDAEPSARDAVARHAGGIGALRYAHEPTPGIPFARNHALRLAGEAGADLLAFIDDDEYPAADWLVRLVEHWRTRGAELIGGPVTVGPCDPATPRWGRLVNRSLQGRMARKNRRTAAAAAAGRRYTVVTNNWLCDLDWQRRTGLWFDERLQFTGGSDTQFFHDAVRLGVKAGWCPAAVVSETMEPERLTLGYQFRRASMQSIQHFRRTHRAVSPGVAVATVAMAGLRTLTGSLLLVLPVLGIASLTVGMRSLGWADGRLRALAGARSTLYAPAPARAEPARPHDPA